MTTNILPIPSCLKGREVRRLEDAIDVGVLESVRDISYEIEEELERLDTVLSFYRQPFTLEMLEVYFGFVKVGRNYRLGSLEIYPSKLDTMYFCEIDGEPFHRFTINISLDSTLSDFISDCKRNGILLTWRSE